MGCIHDFELRPSRRTAVNGTHFYAVTSGKVASTTGRAKAAQNEALARRPEAQWALKSLVSTWAKIAGQSVRPCEPLATHLAPHAVAHCVPHAERPRPPPPSSTSRRVAPRRALHTRASRCVVEQPVAAARHLHAQLQLDELGTTACLSTSACSSRPSASASAAPLSRSSARSFSAQLRRRAGRAGCRWPGAARQRHHRAALSHRRRRRVLARSSSRTGAGDDADQQAEVDLQQRVLRDHQHHRRAQHLEQLPVPEGQVVGSSSAREEEPAAMAVASSPCPAAAGSGGGPARQRTKLRRPRRWSQPRRRRRRRARRGARSAWRGSRAAGSRARR